MKNETKPANLPKPVIAADLKRDWNRKRVTDGKLWNDPTRMPNEITLYEINGRYKTWAVACLRISGSTRGFADRYYCIGLEDGKMYTAGKGPHVAQVVEVQIYADNAARLKPLLDKYQKGLADAMSIREHRSTSIARTRLRRSQMYGASWMGA